MILNKNDFIEIEFTGRVKNTREVFDTNVEKDLKELNPKAKAKPFVFALGHKMFLDALDEFLIGKEIGKEYEVDLKPEKAFGEREQKAIQIVPSRVFKENKLNPFPGAVFNFDGRPAKVLSVNGGRILVDFNHPLAGKDVSYKIKIIRKVNKKQEQINAFNEFLFKKEFKFELKDKKLIIYVPKQMKEFVKFFKDKYKEVFDLDLDVKEIENTSK